MEGAEDTLLRHATSPCLACSWLAVKVLVYAERRLRRVGLGMVEAGGSGSCRSGGWAAWASVSKRSRSDKVDCVPSI